MKAHRPLALALLLVAGCNDAPPSLYGASNSTSDGSGGPPMTDCSNPCKCVDRGPADFSGEMMGMVPSGADATQTAALVRANHWRTGAKLLAFNGNDKLMMSATSHANYMASNDQQQCWSNPHGEVMGCMGFTGADLGAREQAAGYQLTAAAEDIDWEKTPEAAIDRWLWSVYHRLPFMDYRLLELGYGYSNGMVNGMAAINNVMDFGTAAGSPKAPDQPPVIPVPGDTMVPTAFRGDLEGPTPPGPGDLGMWPSGKSSGQVISIHFSSSDWKITEHHLYANPMGACMEVQHTLISKENDMNLANFMSEAALLYANDPLMSGTEYVVVLSGMYGGKMFTRAWAFTTGA